MLRLLVVIVVLLTAAPSRALDPWRGEDTAREAAFAAIVAVDVAQTRWFLQRPDRFEEINPFLGHQPSGPRLYASAIGGLVAHAIVARVLPQRARSIFQHVSIAIDAGFVVHNVNVTGGFYLSF